MLEAQRGRVAATARRVAAAGLVTGSAGNISERAGDLIAVTAAGTALADASTEEVVVVDVRGERVEGEPPPTSELPMHLGIYARYDSCAVVHTHPTIATALSCVVDELPLVHYQMLALGGPVRVAPQTRSGSSQLAEAAVDALRDRSAALMANHGAVVRANDLDMAVEHSLLLEWACGVYWHAAALGAPRTLDR